MYVRPDWTIFCNLNTLPQAAGVQRELIKDCVVKELVDNALDASDGCTLEIKENGALIVRDTGNGIPGKPEDIARLFSVSRPLTTSKLRRPTRGALGNGLRVVSGFVISTSGSLKVSTRGHGIHLKPLDNGTMEIVGKENWTGKGTEIEIMPHSVSSDHAGCFSEDDLFFANRTILLSNGDNFYKGKTSAHWYDSDSFYELLLSAEHRTVRDVATEFDGCTGAKAGRITELFRGRPVKSLSRDEAETLLKALRDNSKPVIPKRLGLVGPSNKLGPYYARKEDSAIFKPTRGKIDAEIPFLVEAWIDAETDENRVEVFVNRTYTFGADINISSWVSKDVHIYIDGYRIETMKMKSQKYNYHVFLNITTPYMPIMSQGKRPDLSKFRKTIADTIEKALEKVKKGQKSDPKEPKSIKERKLTIKDIIFCNMDEAVDKVSGGGQYRFSQRQLFYVMRPFVMDETGKDPGYDTFTGYLTDYENEFGKIKGLYRDDRGSIYHPHDTDGLLSLGDLTVERYERPPWTFNKILYIEKEGFFQILRDEQWPEKYDCALITSKGQSTRAAKDLIDLLVESSEEINVFLIHDADAYGTVIYESFQEETRTRGARKIKVINLGLEPWEALEMDLQIEKLESQKKRNPISKYLESQKKRKPTAKYINDHPSEYMGPEGVIIDIGETWADWLQTNRIELNAMTTPQFLEWITRKMDAQGIGKVIPPKHCLIQTLRSEIKENLADDIRERILLKAGFSEKVEKAMEKMKSTIDEKADMIEDQVRMDLEKDPFILWKHSVKKIGKGLVQEYSDRDSLG